MTKTRIIVTASFLIVFAAGVASGLFVNRLTHRPRRGSWLTAQLDLTPEQEEQMRQVWSDVMGRASRDHADPRAALQKERDEAVKALLSDEQKLRYEGLVQEYAGKVTQLSEERRKIFQEAQERTKQILTESQREKYEEILKKGTERGGRPRERERERTANAQDTPRGEE